MTSIDPTQNGAFARNSHEFYSKQQHLRNYYTGMNSNVMSWMPWMSFSLCIQWLEIVIKYCDCCSVLDQQYHWCVFAWRSIWSIRLVNALNWIGKSTTMTVWRVDWSTGGLVGLRSEPYNALSLVCFFCLFSLIFSLFIYSSVAQLQISREYSCWTWQKDNPIIYFLISGHCLLTTIRLKGNPMFVANWMGFDQTGCFVGK